MVPIAIFDLLGTVGTTVGLELAGSAIFGIILGSITMWTALFTRLIMGQRQSWTRLFGIGVVICAPAPTSPLHLPYISLVSPRYLPHISPASPLHLPYTSPLHLPYISPISWKRERKASGGARS